MDVQQNIFKQFVGKKRLRFSEIEKALEIKSNTLAYHLNNMVKNELLTKDEDDYLLTMQAEGMLPFITEGMDKRVLPVVIAAIMNEGKILLLKRKRRPYKGYWALPGGKLKLDESISECALREVKEETGLDCNFSHLASVIHERVQENEIYKHAFVLFLTVVKPTSTKLKESDEGKLDWFLLKDLQPSRIIPSDYHMIQNHLDGTAEIKCVIMEEKEEKLVKFKQTKI